MIFYTCLAEKQKLCRLHQHGIHLKQMGIIYSRFLSAKRIKDNNHVGK